MTALWLLALIGLAGSVLLLVAVILRWLLFSRHPFPAAATTLERQLRWLGLVAAVVGSASLFVMPAYQGGSCSVSATITTPSNTSSASEVSMPITDCTSRSVTFLEANGPDPVLVSLFTVPVLFALIPFAFRRQRFRGLADALCAFLLAAQAAMGMSGYGLVFAPSSVALLLAGLASILRRREHAA